MCLAGVEPGTSTFTASHALPLHHRHRPSAEGAGVEPARLVARPVSNRLPSPVGWPLLMNAERGVRSAASKRFPDRSLLLFIPHSAFPIPHSEQWSRLDSNQRPSPCRGDALPLDHGTIRRDEG